MKILFFLVLSFPVFAQTGVYFSISEKVNEQEVVIPQGKNFIFANAEGLVIRQYSENNPEEVMGIATIKEVKENQTILNLDLEEKYYAEVGDFILLQVNNVPKSNLVDLFYLARQGITLLDTHHEPFYDIEDLLLHPLETQHQTLFNAMKEALMLKGNEIQNQAKNQKIIFGRYSGQMLHEVMQNISSEDLNLCFKFIRKNIDEYRGGTWKLTEVFETWAKLGSSTEDMLSLASDDLIEETPNLTNDDRNGCVRLLDLEEGTLDGVSPRAAPQKIEREFFCGELDPLCIVFSSCQEGFYFYTSRNLIEVTTGFVGEVSIDLFNKNKEEVREILGEPDEIRVNNFIFGLGNDGGLNSAYLYDREYGTLVIRFDGIHCHMINVFAVKRKNVIIRYKYYLN